MNSILFITALAFFFASVKAECPSSSEIDACTSTLEFTKDDTLQQWCRKVQQLDACFYGCTMAEIEAKIPGYEENLLSLAEKAGCGVVKPNTCDLNYATKCANDLQAQIIQQGVSNTDKCTSIRKAVDCYAGCTEADLGGAMSPSDMIDMAGCGDGSDKCSDWKACIGREMANIDQNNKLEICLGAPNVLACLEGCVNSENQEIYTLMSSMNADCQSLNTH